MRDFVSLTAFAAYLTFKQRSNTLPVSLVFTLSWKKKKKEKKSQVYQLLAQALYLKSWEGYDYLLIQDNKPDTSSLFISTQEITPPHHTDDSSFYGWGVDLNKTQIR